MLPSCRSTPSAALVALVLILAGCTAGRHTPSPTGAVASDASGKGIYKVGKPYQIDGAWYYPAEDWSYDETGIASWYGEAFHGKDTANGETFDLNAMSAAHRTLPLPTIVQVTNLDNGRSIQIRINDRGPYARGRIIDMSRRSAQLLGLQPLRQRDEREEPDRAIRHGQGDRRAQPGRRHVPRAAGTDCDGRGGRPPAVAGGRQRPCRGAHYRRLTAAAS